MKVSVNTVRFINQHYGSAGDPAPDGVEALVQKIGAQLGAVEEVIPFGEKYEGVLIVRIVSCEQHPNADRLHICMIDDGGKAAGLERDEDGHVQVVCGAPNVRAGMLAAWLPPGQTVPSTYHDSDPFVLEARTIRGQTSNGMLASPKELAFSDSHEGILEITFDHDEHIEPGTLFADACHLRGDVIIDMENKMFTHRPDCFGYLGIAREIEGISGRPYKSPEWYRIDPEIPGIEAEALPLEVHNEIPGLVPRFTAIALRDVEVKPSPLWLQADLARAGIRSINNIVDYTNFFMLETGQPLHAYDYDKVKSQDAGADRATIVVRHPRQGEKITLLNGKEIEPRDKAVMIATKDALIGVGGVMGGGDTEVDENTRNVIIECANFDMYSIRRTSMAHGLFTDAVTRFNKGQSPLQNLAVLAKIVDEIRRFAGGKVASAVIDDNHLPAEMLKRGSVHPPVQVTPDFISARLGFALSAEAIAELLRNVEFEVRMDDKGLKVTAPFWRTDIAIPEDIVEEVGRLYGYDHLPLELPVRDLTPATKDTMLTLASQLRSILGKFGANEVLTYSFVHGNLLDKAGQSRELAFRLSNALSPDLQYYRLSLTPSLLERVHPNAKAGYEEFALFELGKVHTVAERDKEGLPREVHALSLVFAAGGKAAAAYAGAPYYQARKYLMHLLGYYQTVLDEVSFKPLAAADLYGNPWLLCAAAPYDPDRSAVLQDKDGLIWGVVGEYKASVRKALKLPGFVAGFELDPLLFARSGTQVRYGAQSRFPKVEQDLCLKVPADTPYADVFNFVWEYNGEIDKDVSYGVAPVDIYQRKDDTGHKQITLRLSASSHVRTLTDEEVNTILDRVAAAANKKFGAERV